LHELIGIEHNVVNLGKVNKQFLKEKVENQKFVVGYQDAFYNENRFSNFGDLASNVKVAIDTITKKQHNSVKIENLEDMQRALDALPELKQHSSNVQKHVTLTCEISRLVEERVFFLNRN
jgi:vacuolar protein sorting-associated protein 45